MVYSIAETAKANGLKPYEYFRYLLEELPKHGELEKLSYVEGCFRGPRHCRNATTRKRHLKTDQVSFYLPSTKGGIIFSRVLDMEHLLSIPYISPTILISPLEFFSQLCYSIQDRAINV
nr:transposase domain-containing protein [Eisenbergiella porci]